MEGGVGSPFETSRVEADVLAGMHKAVAFLEDSLGVRAESVCLGRSATGAMAMFEAVLAADSSGGPTMRESMAGGEGGEVNLNFGLW